MSNLAGQEIINFGYDKSNKVNYKFNSLGFRSPEQHNRDSVIVVGNSIGFGIGLLQEQTYGYQAAQQLGLGYINCAVGCYFHENHDHLINLQKLSARSNKDLFVIQINNLDRHRIDNNTVITTGNTDQCVAKFIDYFDLVESILKDKQRVYLYWDNINYELPTSIKNKLLIHNKFHIDSSLDTNLSTFGIKSHRAISKVISTKLA